MKKSILHTEASPGWGGQEIRILKEAIGMRDRGHKVIMAIQKGGGLIPYARKEGFEVYEIPFSKGKSFHCLFALIKILIREKIDIINTHSSLDSWIGGIAGRLLGKKVIRTRHLSTPINGTINRFLLYRCLADKVITTCEETAKILRRKLRCSKRRCLSVPTGVDPETILYDPQKVEEFRASLGLTDQDCLVGTLAVMRGWKGISDLLFAAKKLQNYSNIKWLIIGGGVSEVYFRQQWKELGLEKEVFFTGHLDSPYVALASLDIFLLLSWANEGVSQASLQAGWLKKPLITTPVGGLPEVCIPGVTGLIVPPQNPDEVALAVEKLVYDQTKRKAMGEEAYKLVKEQFLFSQTLDKIEKIYSNM